MPDPKGGKGKKGGGAASSKGKSGGAKSDFGAEYAVSGGSTCKGCAAKIAKGESDTMVDFYHSLSFI